jgi:N-glycosylase/DNA lyase
MNVAAIDRTIRVLCSEVWTGLQSGQDWREHTEETLLYEASVCMFSSQMVFEMAEATAERIMCCGLLQTEYQIIDTAEYEQNLLEAIADPIPVTCGARVRRRRPRFKKRLASMLATTVHRMRAQGTTLRSVLRSCHTAEEARESLVDLVWGFGPKQASLFLRRIGYCTELAVLDTHILDYLRVMRGINPKPSSLSRLAGYKQIEVEFKKVAEEFGYPVGCVDLAMWVTMRVAKREAVW